MLSENQAGLSFGRPISEHSASEMFGSKRRAEAVLPGSTGLT